MVWNHRIVRHRSKHGDWYAIHEVYYPEVGADPDNITIEPVAAVGDTPEEVRTALQQMLRDCDASVLDFDSVGKVDERRTREEEGEIMDSSQTEAMQQAQTRFAERVIPLPDVVGVAIGRCEGKPCFTVYVVRRTDALIASIPTTFENYTVKIVESGEIRAQTEES